jgi:hypothetical protein
MVKVHRTATGSAEGHYAEDDGEGEAEADHETGHHQKKN